MSNPSNQTRPLRVAVLMGGIGSERRISLESGCCVVDALTLAGFAVLGWDCVPDRLDILKNETIDVFFVALHGEFGEDGQLQEILETNGCCYTGSNPQACKLAFDKKASKQLFIEAGLNTPQALTFNTEMDIPRHMDIIKDWEAPWVVKPIKQGSSVGVHIVDQPDALNSICQKVLRDHGQGMIEQFITGRELTVGVVDHQVLPVIEIKPQSGFFNYRAKYEDSHTQYLFDTVDSDQVSLLEETALTCVSILGLRHFARIDFILSDDGTLYILEANSIPGLTTHSLLPKAAAQAGMSMSTLCSRIVNAAYQGQACKAPMDASVSSL